jgi:hypothetical protein
MLVIQQMFAALGSELAARAAFVFVNSISCKKREAFMVDEVA